MAKQHRVHFRNENVTVRVTDGTNLRQACLDSGIDPYPVLGGVLSCHSKGFCGTCAVVVDEPEHLSPAGKRESSFLQSRGMHFWRPKGPPQPGRRLSCQASVVGDLIVTTAPDEKPAWRGHSYYSGRPTRSWEPASSSTPQEDGA